MFLLIFYYVKERNLKTIITIDLPAQIKAQLGAFANSNLGKKCTCAF